MYIKVSLVVIRRCGRCREDAELQEKAEADRSMLPSTVEGFKKHPTYVLQRHIGRYVALHPDAKAVGYHRCPLEKVLFEFP